MKQFILITLGILVLIQFIRPDRTNPPVDESVALKVSGETGKILKRSCYDCHSDETKWPWYSNIAPFSWSIVSHVKNGRLALNFSKWKEIPKEIKVKRLKRAIKTTANGMMPLPSYLWIHKDAKLSKNDKAVLKAWFEERLKQLQ